MEEKGASIFHKGCIRLCNYSRVIDIATTVLEARPEVLRSSRQEVLDRVEQIGHLYKRIESDGYQPQYELVDRQSPPQSGLFLDTLDEVAINVGRDGELLHVDGLHRLSIAKIQGIDRIPVVFLVRHPQWMEYRDSVAENGNCHDHSDLRDLGRECGKKGIFPDISYGSKSPRVLGRAGFGSDYPIHRLKLLVVQYRCKTWGQTVASVILLF
ncbi:hypothetical protein SAMN04515672_0125 [Natronorubrum texcoconense]|uniref:ParB-like nuclease domain-containing protein n=1 Tax=Natronorubrum texcoconense TaxID=1095776 RepID=A0A1G9H6J7_9EURY|nr:hypothetical protein SAMN04515672_0125 [Natronorubrum texcoconense]